MSGKWESEKRRIGESEQERKWESEKNDETRMTPRIALLRGKNDEAMPND